MPAPAECPLGASPSSGLRAPLGGAPCTWSRRPSQHFVRGRALLENGLNISTAMDDAQLRQNEAVMLKAFALHEGRCCGC